MKKRRGFIQIAILHLLREEPMHGYQIMKELESRSGWTLFGECWNGLPSASRVNGAGYDRSRSYIGQKDLLDKGKRESTT